jgi:ferredoxin--NADP+ reductase
VADGEAPGDLDGGRIAPQGAPEAVLEFLAGKGVEYIEWAGWELLDAHERSLGEAAGRERVKVVPREEMVTIARALSK